MSPPTQVEIRPLCLVLMVGAADAKASSMEHQRYTLTVWNNAALVTRTVECDKGPQDDILRVFASHATRFQVNPSSDPNNVIDLGSAHPTNWHSACVD
ncbi:hypothetical protein B0H15DRAFT_838766 [Mycena belliarum]|uniref:Uncharacterized protein n=1 Tax=Mycena belliarum TaxID=1033014 RepID=A0AAD6XPH4_9AGAR|nr:hypothetical protein B0H15DRAFT_838766 [Mycena belliae]